MQIVAPLLVPEVTVSLLAVLGLLSLWQYHQNHVLAVGHRRRIYEEVTDLIHRRQR